MPKVLQPVGGQTFLDARLAPVRACGFHRFHFCLGHLAGAVSRHLAATYFDLDVTTSVESSPQGTISTYRALRPAFGELDEAIGPALEAGVKTIGVTIHLRTPLSLSPGPIIAQQPLPVDVGDTVKADGACERAI